MPFSAAAAGVPVVLGGQQHLIFGGIAVANQYKRHCLLKIARGTGAATFAHIFRKSLAISPAWQARNRTLSPEWIWFASNPHRSVELIR